MAKPLEHAIILLRKIKEKKILARTTLKTACDLHFVVHDNAIANSCMHTKSENGPSIRDVQCKQRTWDHNFRMSYTIWHRCVVKESHRVKWHTHTMFTTIASIHRYTLHSEIYPQKQSPILLVIPECWRPRKYPITSTRTKPHTERVKE